jgi:subtilisin family serine protease
MFSPKKREENKMKTKLSILMLFLATIMIVSASPMPTVSSVKLAEEGPAYFVVFSGWNLPSDVDTIIAGCGGRVVNKFPNVGVLVAMPTIDPAAFEGKLNSRSEIIDFGHDYVSELPAGETLITDENSADYSPPLPPPAQDGRYYRQWFLWHTIEANPDAWSITKGSKNIKVAILDTGIDYNHPDIAPNYDFALSANFVDWNFDGVPDEPIIDQNGHGTWCGGTVAAAIGGGGCIGIGPNLDLVNLKVMGANGSGYFEWDFGAIYWAVEHDINVVSMSFGGYAIMAGGAKQGDSALFAALNRLFNYANRNGVVCVAAAGNGAYDMSGFPYGIRHLPSQCSNVIAVIGTDMIDNLASYSNYGSNLHGISAPGGDMPLPPTPPAWFAPYIPYLPYPQNTYYSLCYGPYLVIGGLVYYAWMGGTSMAAPQVAGVAGLLLSLKPNLTPSQVQHYLQAGATDIGKPGYDKYFNFGLLNAYHSLLATMGPNGKNFLLDA